MSPSPGDVVETGELAGDWRWRYRTRINGAGNSFRYEVSVDRVRDAVRCPGCPHRAHEGPCGAVVIIDGCGCLESTKPVWDKVASELCATLRGARYMARKLRRRHVKRFGEG